VGAEAWVRVAAGEDQAPVLRELAPVVLGFRACLRVAGLHSFLEQRLDELECLALIEELVADARDDHAVDPSGVAVGAVDRRKNLLALVLIVREPHQHVAVIDDRHRVRVAGEAHAEAAKQVQRRRKKGLGPEELPRYRERLVGERRRRVPVACALADQLVDRGLARGHQLELLGTGDRERQGGVDLDLHPGDGDEPRILHAGA
jgi:hypothetical protein